MSNSEIKALIYGAVKQHQAKAVYDVIVNGVSAYLAEKQHDLPHNTLAKVVNKVKLKIKEFEENEK